MNYLVSNTAINKQKAITTPAHQGDEVTAPAHQGEEVTAPTHQGEEVKAPAEITATEETAHAPSSPYNKAYWCFYQAWIFHESKPSDSDLFQKVSHNVLDKGNSDSKYGKVTLHDIKPAPSDICKQVRKINWL